MSNNQPPVSQIPRMLTIGAYEGAYKQMYTLFHESEQREEMRALFERTILPLQSIQPINRVICIGLGTLSSSNDMEEMGGLSGRGLFYIQGLSSMTQFVAFEYFLSLLKTRATISDVIFVDPDFNDIDREFLQKRDYEVLQRAQVEKAQENMTTETFLFAPIGNFPDVIADYIEVAHPRLFIGSSIEPSGHAIKQNPEDPNNSRFWTFPSAALLSTWGPKAQGMELQRRRKVRPFQRTHIGRPLLRFSDWILPENLRNLDREISSGEYSEKRGFADEQIRLIHPALSWTSLNWIHWLPDNKSRLWDLDINEFTDLPCPCHNCMKVLPLENLGLSRERPPSPITPVDVIAEENQDQAIVEQLEEQKEAEKEFDKSYVDSLVMNLDQTIIPSPQLEVKESNDVLNTPPSPRKRGRPRKSPPASPTKVKEPVLPAQIYDDDLAAENQIQLEIEDGIRAAEFENDTNSATQLQHELNLRRVRFSSPPVSGSQEADVPVPAVNPPSPRTPSWRRLIPLHPPTGPTDSPTIGGSRSRSSFWRTLYFPSFTRTRTPRQQGNISSSSQPRLRQSPYTRQEPQQLFTHPMIYPYSNQNTNHGFLNRFGLSWEAISVIMLCVVALWCWGIDEWLCGVLVAVLVVLVQWSRGIRIWRRGGRGVGGGRTGLRDMVVEEDIGGGGGGRRGPYQTRQRTREARETRAASEATLANMLARRKEYNKDYWANVQAEYDALEDYEGYDVPFTGDEDDLVVDQDQGDVDVVVGDEDDLGEDNIYDD